MTEAEVESLRSYLHRLKQQPAHHVGNEAQIDYAIMCATSQSVFLRSDAAQTLAQEVVRLRLLIKGKRNDR